MAARSRDTTVSARRRRRWSGCSGHGLNVLAPQSAIRGLMVNGFVQDGSPSIAAATSSSELAGVAPSGTAAKPNGVGVRVLSSQGNVIGGGQSVLARNVISGNNTNGVAIGGTGATLNAVEGNHRDECARERCASQSR